MGWSTNCSTNGWLSDVTDDVKPDYCAHCPVLADHDALWFTFAIPNDTLSPPVGHQIRQQYPSIAFGRSEQ